MNAKFLVVDDDIAISGKFKIVLDEMNLQADFISSYEEVIPTLKASPYSYAGVFLDHNLKNKNGKSVESLSLVPLIRDLNPFLTLVMISGDRSEDNLKKWLNLNLDKFLYKPIEATHIKAICEYSLNKFDKEFGNTECENAIGLSSIDQKAINKVQIIAQSKEMATVCKDIVKFSKSNSSVVLVGETGTGKELLAKALHENSNRSHKPYLVLNCSSYNSSSELLESELFGHLKGAFTGADSDKEGIFEKARGGTVFLDEIHHLCMAAQAKLLRVLQENKIRRVGDFKEKEVEFALVCAGKPELMEMVKTKEFLPDLFYRIFFLDIKVPALRERKEDILPLIKHFAHINERKYNTTKVFSNSSLKALTNYSWPGNVRELESTIESLFVKMDRRTITVQELGDRFNNSKVDNGDRASVFEGLVLKHRNEQRVFILETLNEVGFNITRGAKRLSLARTSLISKMKSLGLDGLNKNDLQGIFKRESLELKGAL